MVFTTVWGTALLIRWYSTCHLSEKGKESLFFPNWNEFLDSQPDPHSSRWWNLEFLQTEEEVWDQWCLGQDSVPTATGEQAASQTRSSADRDVPKPAQGCWGGCLTSAEGHWHAGLLSPWVSLNYLLNLSWELALNLPRFKNKTQNFLVDFHFNMAAYVAVLFLSWMKQVWLKLSC